MSIKIGVLGTKFNTLEFVNNPNLDFKIDTIISLDPKCHSVKKIAGYSRDELKDFATKNVVDFKEVTDYTLKTNESSNLFAKLKLDILFVMGWERLIPNNILQLHKHGSYGMHGSAFGLPRGKGRSPLNWALITGAKKFHTSLFKYEDNIDGGDIYASEVFDIFDTDTIEDLHIKNLCAMVRLSNQLTNELHEKGFVTCSPQICGNDTYYPKRIPEDGVIDWNTSNSNIVRFINALSKPYPPAYSHCKSGGILNFYDAKPFYANNVNSTPPGTILEIFSHSKSLLVATNDGAVRVKTDYDLSILKRGTLLISESYKTVINRIATRHKIKYPDHKLEKLTRGH